jgi:hypothetical protein
MMQRSLVAVGMTVVAAQAPSYVWATPTPGTKVIGSEAAGLQPLGEAAE